MNFKILLLAGSLLSISLWSCNDDDENDSAKHIPEPVKIALTQKYPDAKKVEWETKREYHVAEFYQNKNEVSAWFDGSGVWLMSQTDLQFTALLIAIQNDFKAGAYKSWVVEDVDMLERKDFDVVYILEAELGKEEVDLYYSAEGILVKAIKDKDNQGGNNTPQAIDSAIAEFIAKNYEGARILEIEREHQIVEVDIIHKNKALEVVFDLNNNWLHTSQEVQVDKLPLAVTQVVNLPQYQGYFIDEAHFIETKDASYYLLELEKGDTETQLKVDEQGTILN
ncbi:PepSY-like domain-containing protein [Bacteroides propionicifaciens]|uniref:PepSY-like domain-containing protein n=1 Tax=Bacteroides propionicifaciens TaxID=392838 RepID=UPI00036A0A74|nr:PepSY-like domain-containing protein [Bacteroides propionicifaciens]